jgi:hypothetical protein
MHKKTIEKLANTENKIKDVYKTAFPVLLFQQQVKRLSKNG